MHLSVAMRYLKEADLRAEVETDGPAIFILAHDVHGRMHMLPLKDGHVSSRQVGWLLDTAAIARRTD